MNTILDICCEVIRLRLVRYNAAAYDLNILTGIEVPNIPKPYLNGEVFLSGLSLACVLVFIRFTSRLCFP